MDKTERVFVRSQKNDWKGLWRRLQNCMVNESKRLRLRLKRRDCAKERETECIKNIVLARRKEEKHFWRKRWKMMMMHDGE